MNKERRVLLSKYMAQAELQSRMRSINLSEEEQKTFFRRYDMFEKKAFKTISGLNKNNKGSKSVTTMENPLLSQRGTARGSTFSTSQTAGLPNLGTSGLNGQNNSMFGATITTIKDLGTTGGSAARQSPTLHNGFGMTSSTFTLGNNSKLEGYTSSLSPTMRKIRQASQFQFDNLNMTNTNPGSLALEEEKLMRSSPFHRNVSQFKIRRQNPIYRSLSANSIFENMQDCSDKLRFECRLRNEESRQLREKIKDWKDYEKANMQKDPIVSAVRNFTKGLRDAMEEDAENMRQSFELCWDIGMRLDRLSDKLGGKLQLLPRSH